MRRHLLPATAMRQFFNAIAKPFVVLLLRSPLHRLLSKHLLLLTVTGRKTGKRFTFPVSYAASGDLLHVVSRRDRFWWRNLKGGAPVTVWLNGQMRRGLGTLVHSPANEPKLPEIVVQIQLV